MISGSTRRLDQILAAQPLKTPTMYVAEHLGPGGHVRRHGTRTRQPKPKDTGNDRKSSSCIGPWRHSGVNADGSDARTP